MTGNLVIVDNHFLLMACFKNPLILSKKKPITHRNKRYLGITIRASCNQSTSNHNRETSNYSRKLEQQMFANCRAALHFRLKSTLRKKPLRNKEGELFALCYDNFISFLTPQRTTMTNKKKREFITPYRMIFHFQTLKINQMTKRANFLSEKNPSDSARIWAIISALHFEALSNSFKQINDLFTFPRMCQQSPIYTPEFSSIYLKLT